jgi:hypothetical protein
MYGAQRGLELGRHLLLVETRRSERRYLADALVGAGYRVSAVADIQGAARLAEALIFDAIVYGARVPASERERLTSSDACLRLTIPQENGLSLAVGCQGRRGRVRSLIGRLEHGLADRPLHRSLVPRIEMGRVSFDLADEFLMADGNRQPLSPMQTFVLRRLALAGGRPLPRAKLHRSMASVISCLPARASSSEVNLKPPACSDQCLEWTSGLAKILRFVEFS